MRDPGLIGRLARLAVTAFLIAGLRVAAAADGTPNTSNRESSIRQAETEAEARHTRALRECAAAADYASCARDADATLHDTRRRLTGEQQRAAPTPGSAAQDAQRVQGERLIRDLEQAAPRPPLRRPAEPGRVMPDP